MNDHRTPSSHGAALHLAPSLVARFHDGYAELSRRFAALAVRETAEPWYAQPPVSQTDDAAPNVFYFH